MSVPQGVTVALTSLLLGLALMHGFLRDDQQKAKGPDLTDEPLYVTPLLGTPVAKPAGLDAWAGGAWTLPVMKKAAK